MIWDCISSWILNIVIMWYDINVVFPGFKGSQRSDELRVFCLHFLLTTYCDPFFPHSFVPVLTFIKCFWITLKILMFTMCIWYCCVGVVHLNLCCSKTFISVFWNCCCLRKLSRGLSPGIPELIIFNLFVEILLPKLSQFREQIYWFWSKYTLSQHQPSFTELWQYEYVICHFKWWFRSNTDYDAQEQHQHGDITLCALWCHLNIEHYYLGPYGPDLLFYFGICHPRLCWGAEMNNYLMFV